MFRVIKVGGSLFDWPELPQALDAWLNAQDEAINVIIAGGGPMVDAIREASQTFFLPEETAHWLAVDAMAVNSRLLANLLTDSKLISKYGELQSAIESDSGRQIVFDAKAFLWERESKVPGVALPHNWSVTSDSIAARLAEALKADELILLKSADPPSGSTTELADVGFVDRYFQRFDGCHFQRRFVNLRRFCLSRIAPAKGSALTPGCR